MTGIVTDAGEVSTPIVVIAAGIHTPSLARTAGATIPVVAKRGQIVTTEPLPPTIPIPVGGLRQVSWGSVIVGTTYEDAGYSRSTDVPTMSTLTARGLRLLPALKDARAIRFWAGLRPWPIDGLSIVGQVPETEGLFVAATHSGITLAPVIGMSLAELITEGRAETADIAPYSPARFASAQRLREDFEAFWSANQRDLSRV